MRPIVIVDGEAVRLWPWSTWRDAVTACDPAAGDALRHDEAWIEDGAGRIVDPDGAVVDGASIKVRRESLH